MKKLNLIFSVFVCLIAYGAFGQPGELPNVLPFKPDNTRKKTKCVDAELTITKLGEIVYGIGVDCLENYNFQIKVNKNCDDDFNLFQYCSHRIEIIIGGNVIASHKFEEDHIFSFEGNLGDVDISNLGFPYSFEVKVIRSCFAVGAGLPNEKEYTIPLTFQMDSSNNIYKVSYWASGSEGNPNTDVELVYCNDLAPSICCVNGRYDYSYAVSVAYTETASTTNTVSLSISGVLSGTATNSLTGQAFPINFSGSLSGGASYTMSRSAAETLKNSSENELLFRLEPDGDNCIGPGVAVQSKKLIIENYRPNCDGLDILDSQEELWIPLYLVPFACNQGEPPSGCDQIPPPNIERSGNGNFQNFQASNCNGYIHVSVDGQEELFIEWTGPEGFTSHDFELNDIEIGEYHYTIWNECCDEITGSVNLCDNMSAGTWYPGGGENEYCHILSCLDSGSPGLQLVNSDCEVEECVFPDEIKTYFNGSKCMEAHYYKGEFLGEQILSSGETNIAYNEQSQQCTKTIMCGGELIDEAIEFPIYGPWTYDEFNELCTRTVMCFSQEMTGQNDTKEPTVTEEYNSTTGFCEKKVYCDGIPQFVPPSPPIFNSPWVWNEWNGCTKQVQCDVNSNIMTVSGSESFNDWNFNTNTNMCESSVSCDNQFVPGSNHSETPNSIGTWSWIIGNPQDQQCRRQIYCGLNNTLVYDYAKPKFEPTGQTCPGVPGVLQHYVICGGVNTGITTCSSPNDRPNLLNSNNSGPISPSIEVFPNPFKDKITIKGISDFSGLYTYLILNTNGQLIQTGQVVSNSIDASGLNNGVFFIHFFDQNGNGFSSQKIVKI